MTKKMLIDAVRPEETRVAITEDGRLEDFDFEIASRRPLKGNIYLAKVTRVEPSLQAAFVEYGGNRQGFLPFSEIHYDYFQIPVEDRKKLEKIIEKDREKAEKQEEEDDDDEGEGEYQDAQDNDDRKLPTNNAFFRKYKIQEVIKRNQIILIQIIKEERGTKGASLTTFISLPGKYCVLMPKTDNQGGVSRKIAAFDVRKKLRKIVREIETPKGASIIVRTAGADRTKAEIKRDFAYLDKLWEKIRDNALKSTAPALIYEEGDIIKRSIRDMYDNTIDEIVVEGEDAFKDAKNFMTLITPSHAKKVKQHKATDPIFWSFDIEDDLSELYEVEVSLKSGGYVVFNPTEALVAIDVNSGKATRGRNVEETALKTNLEAAREISRQLKLRDLSGLIVIDFIDMLELRNKKNVERTLKDALHKDRARIQIGRISNFGLLEMSRQRLSSSMVENSTVKCPRCRGLGIVRSKHSSSVTLLREIEHDAHQEKSPESIDVFTSEELTDYMKKECKDDIKAIEKNTKVKINIKADPGLMGAQFAIGKEALKELLTAIKESEKEPKIQEETIVNKAGESPVHQDDIEESEIGTFEEEDGDENDSNEKNDDKTEDSQPHHHNRTRKQQPSNRSHGRREHQSREGDRSNNRRSENKGRSDHKHRRSGGSSDERGNHEPDGNRSESRDQRSDGRGQRNDRGRSMSRSPKASDNFRSGSFEEKRESPAPVRAKTEPTTEKEKSMIKSLWKKITD